MECVEQLKQDKANGIKLLYFAHSVRDYNTEAEKKVRDYLEELYPKVKVICPNRDKECITTEKKPDMLPFLNFIRDYCDMMVVMTHKAHVGKGVFMEVQLMQNLQRWLRIIMRDFSLKEIYKVEPVDRYDWKVKYGRIIPY